MKIQKSMRIGFNDRIFSHLYQFRLHNSLSCQQFYQLIHHFAPLLCILAPLSPTQCPYYSITPIKSSSFHTFLKFINEENVVILFNFFSFFIFCGEKWRNKVFIFELFAHERCFKTKKRMAFSYDFAIRPNVFLILSLETKYDYLSKSIYSSMSLSICLLFSEYF